VLMPSSGRNIVANFSCLSLRMMIGVTLCSAPEDKEAELPPGTRLQQ
jgi:hypothetical protein